jgi:hypothetical protein
MPVPKAEVFILKNQELKKSTASTGKRMRKILLRIFCA